MAMITFLLIILVLLLMGVDMYLYNRLALLETAVCILQHDIGGDVIGSVETNREVFSRRVCNVVADKNTDIG